MKKLVSLFALSCACSGDGYEEDADFGEVEQGMVAQATPTLTYGINTSSTRGNCNRTSTGQSCLVPEAKVMRWCVSNGTAPVDLAAVAKIARVAAAASLSISNAMTKFGWSFTHLADDSPGSPEACANHSNRTVMISLGSTGLCGSATGSNIESYVCYNPTVGPLVTESLPGSYRTMTGGVVIVDYDDVVAKAAGSATDTDKLLYHGMGHSLIGLIGIGSQTASSSLLSRRAVLPFSNSLGTSSSENCRALGFNVSSPSTLTLHPTLGCPD